MSVEKSRGGLRFAAVAALGIFSIGAHADDVLTSTDGQYAASSPDGALTSRVKNALHSDPVLYDKHIDVSMEKGNVVLKGFVASAQDLQKALHAATEAAGGRKVINNLTIKEGGDGGSG